MTQAVRIATFNLENLDDRPGEAPALADRIAVLRPQLERLRADILCLQEINAQNEGRKHTPRRLAALDALLGGTAYQDFHRTVSLHRDGHGMLDVQNLAILSRFPFILERQYWHTLVPPPAWRTLTAEPPAARPVEVAWDRPVLHAAVNVDGRALHVINLHLRAPLAAYVAGQKESAFAWRRSDAWAEGFFLATVKRAGQALETRLAVERIFDEEPAARIVVCGDMNAEEREMPLRILRADEDDTGNGDLAGRILVPLERTVPESQRFTVRHAGRLAMLDHVLVSRALMAHYRMVEVHNEALGDEVVGYATVAHSPESYHAPVVAEFEL